MSSVSYTHLDVYKRQVYFQVALTVQDENTLLRELRPLQAIRDHYPKIILTMDEEPEEPVSYTHL